ncbi:hypothetical protein AB0305_03990 [Arthrobacter sp. NPDC080086]|uniref:hypothetical protein n=1 Tax=Arthrobacter sp. NPDC080086 TaxID=3155917 RepID=UPI00344CB2D6
MDMKKSGWMSEAGRTSGERHARLEEQRLRTRSPVDMAAVALLSIIIVAMVGWLIYLQRQDERAATYVRALQQRLAARAKPIHAMSVQGETLYTCTTKTGWIYTAPTEAELRTLCGSQS